MGTYIAGGQYLDGYLDDLAILDHALTSDEERAIYESDAPVFAETSTWGFKSSSQLVWADAEGLWAIDSSGNPAFGVSGVNGKSWGGANLDAGDILMGRAANYAKWDASLGALTLYNSGSLLTQQEYFDGDLDAFNQRWTTFLGAGELSLNIGGGYSGGNSLVVGNNNGDDERWFVSNQSLPFDPTKLYRITCRLKRTAGSLPCYIGVAGRDATDTHYVSATGAITDSLSGSHYVAASASQPADSNWVEYVGYFSGTADSGNGAVRPDPGNPATLHTNVRYFRMMFLVNYLSNTPRPGTYEVDYIRVDILPKPSDSPWRHSTDTTTIDGANIYTGSITADKITTASLSSLSANLGTVTAGQIVVGSTNKLWLNEGNDGVLAVGGTVKGSAPFHVAADGTLLATAATITGTVTATDGVIGGWTVNSGTLANGTNVILDATNSKVSLKSATFGALGIQLDYNAGSPRFHAGKDANNYVKFDGSNLSWRSVNTYLDTAGNLTVSNLTANGGSIAGILTIGTSGGIRQGTGTFGTNFTGLRMWNSGGVGLIGGYYNNTLQWSADLDGSLYAGGGSVRLNSNGLVLTQSSDSSASNLTFIDSSGFNIGYISAGEVTNHSHPTLKITNGAAADNGTGHILFDQGVTIAAYQAAIGMTTTTLSVTPGQVTLGTGLGGGSFVASGWSMAAASASFTGDVTVSGSLLRNGTASYTYIPLATPVTVKNGTWTPSANTDYYFSNTAMGIPIGTKAVVVRIAASNNTPSTHFGVGPSGTDYSDVFQTVQVAGILNQATGIARIGASTQLHYRCTANITSAWVIIYGYFI